MHICLEPYRRQMFIAAPFFFSLNCYHSSFQLCMNASTVQLNETVSVGFLTPFFRCSLCTAALKRKHQRRQPTIGLSVHQSDHNSLMMRRMTYMRRRLSTDFDHCFDHLTVNKNHISNCLSMVN